MLVRSVAVGNSFLHKVTVTTTMNAPNTFVLIGIANSGANATRTSWIMTRAPTTATSAIATRVARTLLIHRQTPQRRLRMKIRRLRVLNHPQQRRHPLPRFLKELPSGATCYNGVSACGIFHFSNKRTEWWNERHKRTMGTLSHRA